MYSLESVVAHTRRQHILEAMRQNNGCKVRAAEAINISIASLYRILEETAGATLTPVYVNFESSAPEKPKFEPEPTFVVFPIKREEVALGETYYHKTHHSFAVVTEVNFKREAVRLHTSQGSRIEPMRTFVEEYGKKMLQ